MPYQGEVANKASHRNMIKQPDVAKFLKGCHYLKPPGPGEAQEMAGAFADAPPLEDVPLPSQIIAIDGSDYESSLDDHLLPSTRIGYVQIGCVLIDMEQMNRLRVENGRYVDPFEVAKLEENNSPLAFPVPSSNVRWDGAPTVRRGFRAAVEQHFRSELTQTRKGDPSSSLRGTLFFIASRRAGPLGTGNPRRLRVHRCPNEGCGDDQPIEVRIENDEEQCPKCGGPIYATDCLRIWEAVTDYQSNYEALGRLMNALENLLFVHYVRFFADNSLTALSSTVFFIDGPLAVYGNAAWLHAPILGYLHEVNQRLRELILSEVLVIGLQKTGQIADYANMLDRHLAKGRLLAIDDDYRYRYIVTSRDPSSNGFGAETHYGQDFIFKTESGRVFVFAIPYPFTSKAAVADFVKAKVEVPRYPVLPRALRLIQHLESDLYKNATIPVVLAHRYTAISLVPGGRVLDILTRKAFEHEPSGGLPAHGGGS